MNKKIKRVLAFMVAFSLVASQPIFAASGLIEKNETVYVIKEDGQVKEQVVSVWLHGDNNIEGKDPTDLKDIKDLKSDREIEVKNGAIHWKEDKKDLYYQGISDKERPVDVRILYELDGKKVENRELEGKSGHLKITIQAENKNKTRQTIDGKEREVYAPYLTVATLSFNEEMATNIQAEDSKVIKDGKNQLVTTVLTPGLSANFKGILKEDQLDRFKDQAVMEMEVTDYQPVEAYVVTSNEFFQEEVKPEGIDELKDGISALEDASGKLAEASQKFVTAQDELNQGIGDLGEGVHQLHAGARELDEKTGLLEEKLMPSLGQLAALPERVEQMAQGGNQLLAGLKQYAGGVDEISSHMDELAQGAEALRAGASTLDDGLGQLKTMTEKFKDGGLSVAGLVTGLHDLSQGSLALSDNLGKAGKAAASFAKNEEVFNANFQAMNTAVQNLPLDALSKMGQVNVKDDLESMGQEVTTIGGSAQDLGPSIARLVALANSLEEAGNSQAAQALLAEAQTLEGTAATIGKSASQLGQSAQNIGSSLQSMKDLQGSLSDLEKVGAMKDNMGKLATASQQLADGSQELSSGLGGLEAGAQKLAGGLQQAESTLAEEMKKMNPDVDPTHPGTNQSGAMASPLVSLDTAIGQLKDGAHRLAEGSQANVQGVNRLASALSDLSSHSQSLTEGAEKLVGGLNAFEERTHSLNGLSQLQGQGISPLRAGISRLNDGLGQLEDGTTRLQDGSGLLSENMKTFSDKLLEFKADGIDKLSQKIEDIPEIADILQAMSDLAKKDASFTGQGSGFHAKYRIVEKVK
ncbi:hypothetical protein [Kallipyga gabonensis]|uniref:hypothetical protein n=1 Tax=Kallipyga gabonensis TaxID=1686287 RepID=UPI0006B66DE4|nr:hypothetical protein [Kallipyga gabonensis]